MAKTANHPAGGNTGSPLQPAVLMNRKIVLIGVASIGLVLGITTLALLIREDGGAKVSVSFLKAEPTHGQFPTYIEGERFDFTARNPRSKAVSVYLVPRCL